MSDESVDRMGDVIEPAGWDLSSFKPGQKFNPIALFNHKADQVVGQWADVRVKAGRLIGRFMPAEPGSSAIADTVRKLIEQNILRAVSVGFEPIEREPLNDKSDEFFGPFRFKRQALLEASIVSVPANPNAVAIAKSMNLSTEIVREVFRRKFDAGTREEFLELPRRENARASKPGEQASNVLRKGATMQPTTLSEKINAAQVNYNVLREALKGLTEKAEDDFTDDEAKRYEELPGEIDKAKAELDKHLAVEQRLMETVSVHKPANPGALPNTAKNNPVLSGEVIAPPERMRFFAKPKTTDTADLLVRALACWAKSQATKDPLDNTFREMYGSDEQTFAVLKAAVNPAQTTVAGWAAELISTLNADWIDRLIPNFIYPQLAAKGVKYTFGPNSGIIKIPSRTSATTLHGTWVGEGIAKPVRRATFTTVSLTPTKLAVISTFTEEMSQYSMPSIEGIIRQAMSDDTGIALDTYLIDAVAVSPSRPAGLLNGVSPITASVLTPATAAMVADLKALINAITALDGGRGHRHHHEPGASHGFDVCADHDRRFPVPTQGEAGTKFSVRLSCRRHAPPAG